MEIKSIEIFYDYAIIIDQTILPRFEKLIRIRDYRKMIEAIKMLRIRGAPAIGVAGAMACFLAAKELEQDENFKPNLFSQIEEIEASRPTAVNLFYATKQAKIIVAKFSSKIEILKELFQFTNELVRYEKNASENMGVNGCNEIVNSASIKILTHCNTGSLATVGIGTALGVIRKISEKIDTEVYVDETRPLLQGARLTAWELGKSEIKYKLITDNMAAAVMKNIGIDVIITGADRIASNGDSANKIGTLNLAILAKYFDIPFYIVAPESTLDRDIMSGDEIKIEQRGADEIKKIKNKIIAPEDAEVYSPAFDVTPANLIKGIITEKQVYHFPYKF